MNNECALYLSTIPVQLHDSKDDVDRLTKNWNCLSDKLKESNLVLDLLNVLSGLDSSFFTWSLNRFTGGYDVVINPLLKKDFDESFFEMCSDILDIRLYQNELLEFVDKNKKSFICQSLSEEIVNVLDDLQQCVAKFHDKHLQSFLGVEKLYNYLKPARQTLSLLSSVVTGYNSTSLMYDKSNLGVLIMDHLEHSWRNEVGLKKELLQHLLNVCLESYFTLIKNYIAYSSVNNSVVDFFIKNRDYGNANDLLDCYSRSTDDCSSRLTGFDFSNNNTSTNKKNDYHNNNDDDDYNNNQYLEMLFNHNNHNDMNLWLDKRYVPKAFRKLAVQVFGTGVYLKLMNKSLEYELIFRNLDDLVLDLEKVYKHVSSQFYEYLKNKCRIFDRLKEFFNYYLFQQSDYVSNLIEKLDDDLDLNQINQYLERLYRSNKGYFKNNNDKMDLELLNNNNEDKDYIYNNSSNSIRNDFDGFYFCFDNMKNLTDSLEFYKYYRNVRCRSSNRFNDFDGYTNCNNDINNYQNNKYDDDYTNNYTNYNNSNNNDNLDYRNLVLCCNLDKASRLLFSSKVVYKYKLVFKLLFQLKYAEHWLNQVSLYHVKTSNMAIDPELVHKFNLQVLTVSRMQKFVKEVLHHFLVDVVSTKVNEFMSRNYDDFLTLYVNHDKLLDSLVNSFLLKDSELVSVLQRLLLLLVKFSSELMNFLNNTDSSLYYDDFLTMEFNSSVDKVNMDRDKEDKECSSNNSSDNNNNKQNEEEKHNEQKGTNDNGDSSSNDDIELVEYYDLTKSTDRSTLDVLMTTNHTRLDRDTDNLNSLLSNSGYCKMVSLARNEFEKNLNLFKSLLSKSEHSLKDILL